MGSRNYAQAGWLAEGRRVRSNEAEEYERSKLRAEVEPKAATSIANPCARPNLSALHDLQSGAEDERAQGLAIDVAALGSTSIANPCARPNLSALHDLQSGAEDERGLSNALHIVRGQPGRCAARY